MWAGMNDTVYPVAMPSVGAARLLYLLGCSGQHILFSCLCIFEPYAAVGMKMHVDLSLIHI